MKKLKKKKRKKSKSKEVYYFIWKTRQRAVNVLELLDKATSKAIDEDKIRLLGSREISEEQKYSPEPVTRFTQ